MKQRDVNGRIERGFGFAWTKEDEEKLVDAVKKYGQDYSKITEYLGHRSRKSVATKVQRIMQLL